MRQACFLDACAKRFGDPLDQRLQRRRFALLLGLLFGIRKCAQVKRAFGDRMQQLAAELVQRLHHPARRCDPTTVGFRRPSCERSRDVGCWRRRRMYPRSRNRSPAGPPSSAPRNQRARRPVFRCRLPVIAKRTSFASCSRLAESSTKPSFRTLLKVFQNVAYLSFCFSARSEQAEGALDAAVPDRLHVARFLKYFARHVERRREAAFKMPLRRSHRDLERDTLARCSMGRLRRSAAPSSEPQDSRLR